MRKAKDFKAGDAFVMLGGKLDPIVSIAKQSFVGKTYNVVVKSEDRRENIIVTNGYLNGSAFYRDRDHDGFNRQLQRDDLTQGLRNP